MENNHSEIKETNYSTEKKELFDEDIAVLDSLLKNKDYDKAIDYVKRLILKTQNDGISELEGFYYKYLAEIYEKKQMYKDAYFNLQKFVMMTNISYSGDEDDVKQDSHVNTRIELYNTLKELNVAYRKLANTQHDLVKAEKLNAVLATAVSANHQIKQPLMIVQGNTELIYDTCNNKYEIEMYYERIMENIQRINEILEKMNKVDEFKLTDYVLGEEMLDID